MPAIAVFPRMLMKNFLSVPRQIVQHFQAVKRSIGSSIVVDTNKLFAFDARLLRGAAIRT
jgi:hypothetical protein